MKLTILTPVAALAVTACASVEFADTGEPVPESAIAAYDQPNGWPAEFSGRTVEIQTRSGVINVVNLAPDGTMTIIPELSTDVVKGTWGTKGDAICINFAPRGEECWDADAVVAANGDFVELRSDRGTELEVRLLNEREEELVDASVDDFEE
jgi:hypothetical protein